MHKSTVIPVALFPRCLPQLEQEHDAISAFLGPYPSFPVKEPGKPPTPQLGRSRTRVPLPHTRNLAVLVATSLSSCWHHVNGHSSLFVIGSVTVSPVLKDYITVISVFSKEHVIHSQNCPPFLLPYLSVLLVLFKGFLNCCCLCASTQSLIFCHQSFISKNVISRDFFPFYR